MGRNQRCVIKTSSASTKTKKKGMPHDEFLKRINKTLYFGNDFIDNESAPHALEMSKPLAEYASELFSDNHRGYTLNRLSCVQASNVQTATPATLIMALIYLDRLNVTDPGYVRRITPQELFIVSMMISTKFYEDETEYISDWADYGNITTNELKQLEISFLCAIGWNIYISKEEFFEKLTSIEMVLAQRQGLRRGWLTYSELIQMLPSFTLAKFFLSNITILAVSYAASVMTIAGAIFLASQVRGISLHRHRTQMSTNSSTKLMNDTDVEGPVKVNGTAGAFVTGVITTRKYNHSHSTLNVEDELAKLERQHREEALRESLLQNNNEISTESRLTLPQQINFNQKCPEYRPQHQQQGYWFANKEEYSEYWERRTETIKKHENDLSRNLLQHRFEYTLDNKTCARIKVYNNSTGAVLLWNYLVNTIQYTTFMRVAFPWLKCI